MGTWEAEGGDGLMAEGWSRDEDLQMAWRLEIESTMMA